MKMTYLGSCLCSAVSFELVTAPKAVTHCHCSQCRKGHGAAFASYGSVPRSDLRVLSGADSIRTYASSPTVMREFCLACGSTLFWSRSQGEYAGWISIALGTLDTPSSRSSKDMCTSTPLRLGTHRPAFGSSSADRHRLILAINRSSRFATDARSISALAVDLVVAA